jgi:phage gpG-like protein
MLDVEIKGANYNEIYAELDRIEAQLSGKDPSKLEQIQKIAYQSTAENFASSGRPHWQARKYHYDWPMLIKTGKLAKTVLASISGRWIKREKAMVLQIFAPLSGKGYPYGHKHQFGWGIVSRPFILLQSDEWQDIRRIIDSIFLRKA